MNPVLNRRFHGKLSKLGLDKKEVVYAISKGRTDSSKNLHDLEVLEWLGSIDSVALNKAVCVYVQYARTKL